MGDYIKASELDASHVGKTVRVLCDKAEAEDVMQAVKHTGRLVTEGRIFERPFTRVAGIETTITFSKLGEVDCEPGQNVRVVD